MTKISPRTRGIGVLRNRARFLLLNMNTEHDKLRAEEEVPSIYSGKCVGMSK